MRDTSPVASEVIISEARLDKGQGAEAVCLCEQPVQVCGRGGALSTGNVFSALKPVFQGFLNVAPPPAHGIQNSETEKKVGYVEMHSNSGGNL